MLTIRLLFEKLFTGLNYFVDNVNVDFSELATEICMYNGIEFAKDLPEFGVKMIFDAIIGSTLINSHFPGIF